MAWLRAAALEHLRRRLYIRVLIEKPTGILAENTRQHAQHLREGMRLPVSTMLK